MVVVPAMKETRYSRQVVLASNTRFLVEGCFGLLQFADHLCVSAGDGREAKSLFSKRQGVVKFPELLVK